MALYAFPRENAEFWARKRGVPEYGPGMFGENLTVEGMSESGVCIGDRFEIGEAVVEVSVPRVPCSKLAMVMDDPEFPKAFLATLNVGFYFRVVREGLIAAGDPIALGQRDPARLSIQEVTRLMYFDPDNREGARRAAGVVALKQSWRDRFAQRA